MYEHIYMLHIQKGFYFFKNPNTFVVGPGSWWRWRTCNPRSVSLSLRSSCCTHARLGLSNSSTHARLDLSISGVWAKQLPRSSGPICHLGHFRVHPRKAKSRCWLKSLLFVAYNSFRAQAGHFLDLNTTGSGGLWMQLSYQLAQES